jgi:hypothetical protein
MDSVILYCLIILNVAQLFFADRQSKRHDATIERLTSKIKAPDLDTYTVNSPERKRKESKAPTRGGKSIEEVVGISEAGENEIMEALARQAGRAGEYEI